MIDQVKAHIERNRERYITGSVVVIAGITCYIMRGGTGVLRVPDGSIVGPAALDLHIRPLSFFSKPIINVVSVIEREGRGHPGYIIRCLETGNIFRSQGEAAKIMNISPSNLSSHLNGKYPSVNDLHFERLSGRI